MGYFYSPAYEIVLAFGLFLLLLSAPSHFRARNTGTMLYICWVTLGSSVFLIDKLIWHDHVRNIAPIWCDIATKIQVGFSVSIGAATVVINKRLYKISKISSVIVTPAEKRRDLIIDLSIGLGIPFMVMILHVVVQGHRANLIQGIGCWPAIYNVPPAYPLIFMWPPLLSLISIFFGMLSLRAFLKRRHLVEEFLNSNSSGLNFDRYFRLMCFASAELTIAFPLGLYQVLVNAHNTPMFPWISWADTHSNFNRIDQIPAIFVYSNPTLLLNFGITLWSIPVLSYLFFIFFGLGREQIAQYKRWFYALLKPFGIKRPEPQPYGSDNRSWFQKLFRLRPSSPSHGTGLNSSRGMSDSLPAFRQGAPLGSHGHSEKPIPSARSKNVLASIDDVFTFDLHDHDQDHDHDHEKSETLGSNKPSSSHLDVNKALPTSPTVVDSSSEQDEKEKYLRASRISTSSASSVAGSSRRVSEAIRDVELSDAELGEIEARVQRMV